MDTIWKSKRDSKAKGYFAHVDTTWQNVGMWRAGIGTCRNMWSTSQRSRCRFAGTLLYSCCCFYSGGTAPQWHLSLSLLCKVFHDLLCFLSRQRHISHLHYESGPHSAGSYPWKRAIIQDITNSCWIILSSTEWAWEQQHLRRSPQHHSIVLI